MLTAAAEMEAHGIGSRAGSHLTPQSQSSASTYVQPMPPHPPELVGPSLSTSETAPIERIQGVTQPRSLNSVHISEVEIDELFHMFFAEYAPFSPILDPHTTPNSYYAQCPFIFWAVIGVASRMYRNPTLLSALGQSITEMAMVSIASTSPQWHIIQGILIILTWHQTRHNLRIGRNVAAYGHAKWTSYPNVQS
ncbi:putative C6 transcription factor (Leu3) [Aspergillus affinis]|uniref:putative C6 transcription factor (Leu3) n=1 Tax=Aspergillus affinis TaxID=1070780 RepID=UPI0022FE490C|nr:Zn(II)2Cys6 transcription factor [Aspergillus affinis]KAI9035403.1 Zn(II)2Cys6 transcription factor [Aspergillus affinis]